MAFIAFIAFGNSFKGVITVQESNIRNRYLQLTIKSVNFGVKCIFFWPSFGLQFYTSFHLASLGTTWYKISSLIPAKSMHFTP